MKKIVKACSLGIAILLIISLVFNPATNLAENDEPVEIRVAWWGDTNRHELYNEILSRFQEQPEYSHITIIPEPTSWMDYWDKLQVQSAGGGEPDFMGMHPQFASDYIRRDVLEPLDSYIDEGILNVSAWPQSVLETGVYDGVNYMLAMGVTYSCNFVNLTALDELGIEPPAFDWSWDDMKTWGIEVREALDDQGKTDAWVVNDDSNNLNSWRYFVRQRGREIYTDEGEIGFTVEDVQTFWEMYDEFRELGIVPDPATSTEYANATLEDNMFSHNKILIQRIPVNQYKLYCDTFPNKEIGIIRGQTAGSYGDSVGEFPEGAHFAISANTDEAKKVAAAQLMDFWLNTEEGLSLFGLDQGVPANLELKEAYEDDLDVYQLEIQNFVSKLSEISTPSTFPAAGASEIDATFAVFGDQVSFDQITIEEAAQEFYDQAHEIIDESK